MEKLKVLDLFSGIGGFSLGLERAGMETVAFCEIDEDAQKVLRKHWPDTPIYEDVSKVSYHEKRNLIEYKKEPKQHCDIDVICGGFPCQDISIAGKKEGLKGERSGLWGEFKRLIEEIKPRYAIIENVANLRSNGLQEVLKDLWKIGYASEWHIISARSVGAPHLRERIWIIAYPHSSVLWEQSRGSSRKSGKKEAQPRADGENGNAPYSNSERLERQRKPIGIQEKHPSTNCSHDESAYANNFRLWKPFASQEESSGWWSKTALSVSHWKEAQSIVCGVDDGLSRGMDRGRKQRIKQLGNSVVPQIPEIIGRAIVEHESHT